MTLSIRPRSCDRAREWASAALDHELSEFEAFLLQDHLAGCAACASYADAIRTTSEAIRRAELLRPSAPVALPVRRRAVGMRAISSVAAAAAVVAAVGIGTLVGSSRAHAPGVPQRLPSSAISSVPGGMDGLIEQPKLAMLHAKAGIGKQQGLGIADV